MWISLQKLLALTHCTNAWLLGRERVQIERKRERRREEREDEYMYICGRKAKKSEMGKVESGWKQGMIFFFTPHIKEKENFNSIDLSASNLAPPPQHTHTCTHAHTHTHEGSSLLDWIGELS